MSKAQHTPEWKIEIVKKYRSGEGAYDSIAWAHGIDTERIQARFDGKTPAEVRAEALASDSPAQHPIPVNKRIQRYKAKYAA